MTPNWSRSALMDIADLVSNARGDLIRHAAAHKADDSARVAAYDMVLDFIVQKLEEAK